MPTAAPGEPDATTVTVGDDGATTAEAPGVDNARGVMAASETGPSGLSTAAQTAAANDAEHGPAATDGGRGEDDASTANGRDPAAPAAATAGSFGAIRDTVQWTDREEVHGVER
jgi:hypothetical protein